MKQSVRYQIADQTTQVQLAQNDEQWQVTVGDQTYQVQVKALGDHQLLLEVAGQRFPVYVLAQGDKRYIWCNGATWLLRQVPEASSLTDGPSLARSSPASSTVTATMPGLVRELLVAEGEVVARGAPLVLLEAMKMELRLNAPYPGRVRKIHCTSGQVVARGQILVELDGEP